MDRPFVSVVLPFHDASSYLAASIESILSQDYDNFELILVDDGSRDGSRQIALSCLSRNVTLICQCNRGVGGAINGGIDMARGRYVFLHGADDIASRDRLRRCVEIFENEEVDMVTCRPDLIDGDGLPIERSAFPVFERACETREAFAMLASLFFLENFICAPAAAVSRKMLDAVGPVHAGLIQLQDFEFWLRGAALKCRFHIDQASWLSYRRHGANLSHQSNLPRADRETQLVYRNLAKLVTREAALYLLHVRAPSFAKLDRLQGAPVFVLKPLVYLAHARPDVRQIGFEMLMEILVSRECTLVFETYTDLAPAHLFELMRCDA